MEYVFHLLVLVGIYSILAVSLNLAVGYTGLTALGHAAFFCAGAYASALATLNWGWSPWAALPLAGAVAAALGLVIGFPSLRVKGDYFALTTFGFGIIVFSIARNWTSFTRGTFGLPGISHFEFFSIELADSGKYLIIVTVLVLFTFFTLGRITNSPFGRVLRSIREDELASAALGKNTFVFKLVVLTVSAFFAGIGGSLYAHHITFIDPSSFTVSESITILLMVVLGGMASLRGSLVGAVVLVLFPELLRYVGLPSTLAAPIQQAIYGALLVGLMLFRPQGLLGEYRWR